MSRHPALLLEVALWEYRRYFKPRQQLVGILITVLSGLAVWGILGLAGREQPVRLTVVGDALAIERHLPARITVLQDPATGGDWDARLAALDRGEVDGVLRIVDPDHARLRVRRRGEWTADVRIALAAARREEMLRRADMSPDALDRLLAAPALAITTADGTPDTPRGGSLALVVTLGVMILAVFQGMAYVFASITGEKQIRVTEQVVSSIPAQTWIDGKVLGLAAVSLTSVASTVGGFALLASVLHWRGTALPLPTALGNPSTVVTIVLFGVLGLFFWFAFLAAIAALIDDPNNSARGPLLFVPIVATATGFLGLQNPTSALVRALSFLPPTAPAAMPARIILGPVPAWHVALSLLLLAAGVLAFRWAAGRVFRLAMLMYGKEPSWADVRRWIFAP